MTDDELLEYLGLPDSPDERMWIARLLWWQRDAYETMRTKEQDIKLWQEGVGPMPTDVILCKEHDHDTRKNRSVRNPRRDIKAVK